MRVASPRTGSRSERRVFRFNLAKERAEKKKTMYNICRTDASAVGMCCCRNPPPEATRVVPGGAGGTRGCWFGTDLSGDAHAGEEL